MLDCAEDSESHVFQISPFPDATASRRFWLQLTSAGLLSAVRAAEESKRPRPAGFGRAQSVIIVFTSGGQSQLEMWDPKPGAPREIRGSFDSISTSVSGVQFGEHMPRTAQIADRLCVVRNMAHEDLDHGTAFYLAQTGRYHRLRSANPLPSPSDFPSLASVLQRVVDSPNPLQNPVHVNGPAEVPNIIGAGQFGGLLGQSFDPLTVGDVTGGATPLPSLNHHGDVPSPRLRRRQSLLQKVELAARRLEDLTLGRDKQQLYSQAFEMLDSRAAREAFDLSQESVSLRQKYGRNRSGQACLLARRLVEAGIPLVNVIWNHNNRGQDKDPADTDLYGWDTHNDIFEALQKHLLPRFDQSFPALIEDLEDRGLLETTLVVCMGEFGRAPLVALEPNFAGGSPGRKHWSWCYSIAFAGAGVRAGSVVGASDERAAYPVNEPYGPWDVAATIYSALGIDPHAEYRDLFDRPIRISEGRVMEEIYG